MVAKTDEISHPDLVAWMGEDEHGSGKVGIKQGLVPAGMIPIVAVIGDKEKLIRPEVVAQLKRQAVRYGKTIRLVRYVPVEVLFQVSPED